MASTFTSCWMIKTTSFPAQPLLSFPLSRILPTLQPAHHRSHSFLYTPWILILGHRFTSFLSCSLQANSLKLANKGSLDIRPDCNRLLILEGLLLMSKPNLQQIIKVPSISQHLIIPRLTCTLHLSYLLPLITQHKLATCTKAFHSIYRGLIARPI